jgi:hypothetical protein
MASFKKGDELDTAKLKREKFALKEIGDSVYITLRALSAPEVANHIAEDESGPKQVSGYKLISICAVDDDGKPLFDHEEDAKTHLKISAESLQKMVKKILDMSGLSPDKDRSKN